jgi:hypothetical protein
VRRGKQKKIARLDKQNGAGRGNLKNECRRAAAECVAGAAGGCVGGGSCGLSTLMWIAGKAGQEPSNLSNRGGEGGSGGGAADAVPAAHLPGSMGSCSRGCSGGPTMPLRRSQRWWLRQTRGRASRRGTPPSSR